MWAHDTSAYVTANITSLTHDLLDDLGRRGEVDQAFMDAQLVAIPSLGTCNAVIEM